MWRRLKADESGFTLVELLAALVIITIFISVAAPTMAGTIEKAKESRYVDETRRVADTVQYLAMEAEAAGTYDFFDFILSIQEMDPKLNKLVQLMEGDVTPGSRIEELGMNDRTRHLTYLVYLVDSYRIKLDFKRNTVSVDQR